MAPTTYLSNLYYLRMQAIQESRPTEEVLEISDELPTDKELYKEEHDLMVYNDDYNTFEHVINTLIRICKHDHIQAEQCTYIVHFRGKCAVKRGTYKLLRPMQEGITQAGISAKIV